MERTESYEIYGSFASVYDTFMDNVDYDAWAKYLRELLGEYGIADGLVLDLGCGTGSLTEALAAFGYDMIGVDASVEMLEAAQEKRNASGADILYLLQDMRAFELYGTVRACVSVCDCVNYITEEEELVEVFRLVNNYLDPEGIFVFDFNTEYKYREVLGDQTIAENREDASFIWDNFYDEEDRLNEYEVTLFIKEGDGGLFRKYQELHVQKAYTLGEMQRLIAQSGLDYVTAYDAYTKDAPREDSERITIVAREHGKQKEKTK